MHLFELTSLESRNKYESSLSLHALLQFSTPFVFWGLSHSNRERTEPITLSFIAHSEIFYIRLSTSFYPYLTLYIPLLYPILIYPLYSYSSFPSIYLDSQFRFSVLFVFGLLSLSFKCDVRSILLLTLVAL